MDTVHKCDKCGSPMAIRSSTRGPFLGCTSYPKCKNAKPLPAEIQAQSPAPPPELTDEKCEQCGQPMLKRQGRFGLFLGCSGYPKCKNLKKFPPTQIVESKPKNEKSAASGWDKKSECQSLLDAATRDLFQKNAFRITGLPVDATTREVAKHAEKIKILAEVGKDAHAQTAAFPIKPSPSLDEIREALHKLKAPEQRLIDEFFWFWPEAFGKSQSDPAIQALAKGDSKTAMEIWTARENIETFGIIAKHNLALANHVWALDLDMRDAQRIADCLPGTHRIKEGRLGKVLHHDPNRKHHLQIGRWMQRVAMMPGMTDFKHLEINPAQKCQDPVKKCIQRPGFENSPVPQLMDAVDHKGGDHPVQEDN